MFPYPLPYALVMAHQQTPTPAEQQQFFAGFVLGTLQNTEMTDAERLTAMARMARMAVDLGLCTVDSLGLGPWSLVVP